MPPHDGDRPPSDGEDRLVAQIIPLRHRERDAPPAPRTPTHVVEDAPHPAPGDVSLGERSVWDPPTAELRRRGTQPGAAPSPTVDADRIGRRVTHLSWRVVVAATATLALSGAVLALVVASGFSGPARSATGRTSVSTQHASSSANTRGVIANRSPSRGSRPTSNAAGSHHQQQPGRQAHRHSPPASSSTAQGTGLTSGVVDSTTPASSGPSPTTASSVAESPPTSSPGESASAAVAPSAPAKSTPQSQCVPGELGC